jgi:hypothetical protein
MERYRPKQCHSQHRAPARPRVLRTYPTRRHLLVEALIAEIEEGGSPLAALYARLTAAALLETKGEKGWLKERFARRLAKLSPEDRAPTKV